MARLTNISLTYGCPIDSHILYGPEYTQPLVDRFNNLNISV